MINLVDVNPSILSRFLIPKSAVRPVLHSEEIPIPSIVHSGKSDKCYPSVEVLVMTMKVKILEVIQIYKCMFCLIKEPTVT